MGKGIIKGVGGSTTPVRTVITTEYDGLNPTTSTDGKSTTPPGGVVKGTITDSQSGASIPFEQPFGMEIGLQDGLKVNYNTVVVNGVTIANCVRFIEKGIVDSVNQTNDGGTIKDKASQSVIPFSQLYVSESGIKVGVPVTYDRVIDPVTAAYVAVCVELK
jgi:hypothetical protein